MIASSSKQQRRTISLRTRLAISFFVLGFLAVGILLAINFVNLRQQLRNDLRERLLNIVSLAALEQDGDAFVQIQSPQDPAFDKIRLQNLRIRASDPDIRFIYTMRYDDQGIYFVVNAWSPGEPGASPYHTRYYLPGPVLQANYSTMNRPMAENTLYTDEYGTFMSAYAPFYTSDGKWAGILGIDIAANNVIDRENQTLVWFLGILLISLPIIAGTGWILGNTISAPITELTRSAVHISTGEPGYRPIIKANSTELSLLRDAFYSTADQLQSSIANLEKRVAERTEQLKATIELGRAASSTLNLDELLSKTVNLITDRFGYYYAAIFIIDPSRQWAELKDASGEAGKILKAQEHRLEVGGKSMVGTAIATNQTRVSLDVGSEPIRFTNPLLSETRSELALPLAIGERVIGAMDVQSTAAAAFTDQDVETLQGIANQVAIALENARLFQETQNSLDELRATQRMYMMEGWSDIAREHKGFEFVSGSSQTVTSLEPATLNVPLTLREQIIGNLHLEGLQNWTPEERGLIEAVAAQTALALENARLLEESQQLALRERLVAEITGKIWSSPSTDLILQTAIKELGRALRADDATIELKIE